MNLHSCYKTDFPADRLLRNRRDQQPFGYDHGKDLPEIRVGARGDLVGNFGSGILRLFVPLIGSGADFGQLGRDEYFALAGPGRRSIPLSVH